MPAMPFLSGGIAKRINLRPWTDGLIFFTGSAALTTGEAPLFFLKEGYLSFPMEGASLVV